MTPQPNDAIARLLRGHVLSMEGYVSAGMEAGKDPSKIYMNANENPYELPGLEGWNRYPEPQPPALLAAYADLYGVKPSQIVATRGADEAIAVLSRLFCDPHKDAIAVHPPTFGIYPVYTRMLPAGVVEVPLQKTDDDFALDEDALIAAGRRPEVKLVFLCNPNNPTASCFPFDQIKRICCALEGQAVILLDETYAEFSAQGSMAGAMGDHSNLIILRTLSKSYALAGMRMGSMLCADEGFIDLVRRKGLEAYPLPHASIKAALHVARPEIKQLAHANIKKLLDEKNKLAAAFDASPGVVRVFKSDANFFMAEMKDAAAFVRRCAARNIIVRDFSTKALTQNCIRVSAGTPAENDLLIEML